MGIFSRGASAEDVAAAVKNAVADATNSVTLAGHMAQCERDKAEVRAAFLKSDQERQVMHAENTVKFAALAAQSARIMRIIWMAAGAMTLLTFMSGNGATLLAKVFRP